MRLKRDKYDKVFSDLVRCRANYTCENCRRSFPGPGPELINLDCSHYIGRSHWRTRIHPDNAFSHCKSCHRLLGDNPGAFYHHYVEMRGADKEGELQRASKKPWKVSKVDKELIYKHYVTQLKTMREERKGGNIGWLDFNLLELE